MPYDVEWNSDEQLVICQLYGPVEGEEVSAAIDEIARLSRSRGETVNVCWDGRDIRTLAMSPSDVEEVVSQMSRFAERHPHGRTAIVTVRMIDQITAKLLVLKSYGNARNRQSFTQGYRICATVDRAGVRGTRYPIQLEAVLSLLPRRYSHLA